MVSSVSKSRMVLKDLAFAAAFSLSLVPALSAMAAGAGFDPDKPVPINDFKANKGPKQMLGGHAYITVGKESAELPRVVQIVAENGGVDNKSKFYEAYYSHEDLSHKIIWGLQGAHAAITIHASKPELAVAFHGMPGVNAADYIPVLVKLSSYKGLGRIVSTTDWHVAGTQSAVGGFGGAQQPKTTFSFKDDVVSATVDLRIQGEAKMAVDNALQPGEYAIVLRPKDPNSLISDPQKSYQAMIAGGATSTTQPWQYAWPFTVQY